MASEGPNSPSTTGNDAGIGTVAWSNTGNITASDDTRANVGLNASEVSNYLTATNFGFSITGSATINGIVVEWEGQSGGGAGTVGQNAVRIIKGGSIGSTDKSTATLWTPTDSTETFGGASDLWGETWSASDINASNFGAALSVDETGGNPVQSVLIDHCQITVHYTENDVPYAAGLTVPVMTTPAPIDVVSY